MLLIFDWDGTLSDSTGKIVRCLQSAARSHGVEAPANDAARDIIGLALPVAMARLFPELGEADQCRLTSRYSEHFLADEEQVSPFYPGVEKALAGFREAGYRMAVATGKSRKGLERVLDAHGWADYFDATRCADETASKPEPLMLQELLLHFGEQPDGALMVGDTEYDMAMARTIGMHRAAVSYGAHHIDRLRPYDPVLCMDRFPELSDWLRVGPGPRP